MEKRRQSTESLCPGELEPQAKMKSFSNLLKNSSGFVWKGLKLFAAGGRIELV
jgi:hypothetical protein